MKKIGNRVFAASMSCGLVLALFGCQESEGPAERAGKEIDQGIIKAGQVLEETGKKMQDAAKDAKK